MSLPSTQAAAVIEKAGDPSVLEYRDAVEVPTPGVGQVLIKNAFTGINYVDTYFRSGLYNSPKPEILGREGAGEVVAFGPDTESAGLSVGDRVAWLGTGGYAQYSVAAINKVVRLPASIPFQDAASSFLGGLTVLAMIDEAYKVNTHDWVLLHAAAGSVGVLMVQILKLRGANVIATAGGSAKVEMVRGLGADHVIDYRDAEGKHWVANVKSITGGRGVDVVFDSVGRDTWEGSLDAVRRKGTVVWFGNASGPVPPLTLHRLAPKCVKIARPNLMGYIETREELVKYSHELFELLSAKKLKMLTFKIYRLDEVRQAHVDVESRKTTGKLLLRL